MLTVGSLFSGIGGFDLGFERAGFKIRWQVEIDDYANAVLAKHWPNVRRYRDVRECRELESVDVVCGGFPCQPHSLAGRRGGSDDERDLWPEFVRLIRELRPRWVVAENVPGLLSSDAGRFFGTVLGDLAASGYDAEWDCLPASAFGAPHRRDRVWIIAYPRMGDPECDRFQGWAVFPPGPRLSSGSETVADAASGIRQRSPSRRAGHVALGGEGVAHAGCESTGARVEAGCHAPRIWRETGADAGERFSLGREYWRVEPNVGRVAHGVPARVDRLRGLGNAIVPAIAEWIARRIQDAEAAMREPVGDVRVLLTSEKPATE